MAGGGPPGPLPVHPVRLARCLSPQFCRGFLAPPSRQIFASPAPSVFATASEASDAPAKAPPSLRFRGIPGEAGRARFQHYGGWGLFFEADGAMSHGVVARLLSVPCLRRRAPPSSSLDFVHSNPARKVRFLAARFGQ